MDSTHPTIRLELDHRNMTTAFDLPGYTIVQNLGIVRGIVVHTLCGAAR